MTIPLPLSVRLKTARNDRHVTNEVRDLSFRASIPGGYASATLTLDRPLDLTPSDIDLYASVYVYDSRNGQTVWEGRLEDPGRAASEQGELWEITAIGPSGHARDITAPYILVDQSLERWHRSLYGDKSAATEQGELDDNTPCLTIRAQEGTTITTSWLGDWIYRSIYYAGQSLARVRADFVCGGASTNYQVGIYTRSGAGSSPGAINQQNWATSSNVLSGVPGDTNFTLYTDVCSLRTTRNVSSTTAGTGTWVDFSGVKVRALLKNADGTDITTGYTVNNVDPVEAVADLLGRFLTRFDGANAILIGSGVDVYQIAYPDGVTPAEVLDDLMVYDPGFYWAAWESNSAGKYRFEYIPWPTTIRYEASTDDGFNAPTSAADLYNSVHVRYRDAKGKVRSVIRSLSVPVLTAAGLTRQAYIDLSDETGDLNNAQHTGDNFLLEHQYPPNAGTLTVSRPILDNLTGRMVYPWELKPGHLIRVRGVMPRVDSLNPTGRDGVTIFKVISSEFSADTCSATLELDSYSRTVARALANLKAKRLRKR